MDMTHPGNLQYKEKKKKGRGRMRSENMKIGAGQFLPTRTISERKILHKVSLLQRSVLQ